MTGSKKPGRSSPLTYFVAGSLVLVVLTGAAIFGLSRMGGDQTAAKPVASPTSASLIELAGPIPSWLASANQAIKDDYTWAASHHDELQYFPCFCGCYQSAGHVSNSECYFHRGGDKRTLDITRDVRKGMDKGKTLTQLRKEIDKLYMSQGMKPTPAPNPPEGK